ncbi:MAG: hypothetical protein FJW83_09360 [Actinobacteria bacterium]|nr:hypothetical protein [Actinomycetota bacterium]
MPTDLIDSRRGDEKRGGRPLGGQPQIPLIRPGPGHRLVPHSEVPVLLRPGVRRLAVVLSCALVVFLGWRLVRATDVDLALADGSDLVVLQSLGLADRPVLVSTGSGGVGATFRVTLAGVPLTDVQREGRDTLRIVLPDGLPEGGYELAVEAGRTLFFRDRRASWPVVIDDTPPSIGAPVDLAPVRLGDPVVLRGALEPGARLEVDAGPLAPDSVRWTEEGYEVRFPRPPVDEVRLVAVDLAGNRTEKFVNVSVAYPTDTRAVHITAAGWGNDEIRSHVLGLVDAGLVNAVQLDLKDEAGIVGYDSRVPRALEAGAVVPEYRLAEALEVLRNRGVRVIGRIVAFRDPVLADWAWSTGRRELVLQTPTGERLADYGGFTNYAHPEVRAYNLAIAEEAAAAGVSDILWDYVRRPEGDPATMVVPGMTGTGRTTGDEMTDFFTESQRRLRALGAYQGASVFGIAATRPENIGQPIDRFAKVLDYVAPMVYPSHYNSGECGVASPVRQPYDIVRCSLADFRTVMAGSGSSLVPWLQDFSLGGVRYGPQEVAAQIRAAREVGASGFLLWNAASWYSYAGTG